VAAAGGPVYDAAFDRDGADDRGIVSGFLFRTDRVSLAAAGVGVQSATPGRDLPRRGTAVQLRCADPKSLNAALPSDVDKSTGVDGSDVFTRAPQVAHFTVASVPGSPERLDLWAISNHFSSTPDARVGQRREQAAYGAALVQAIAASDPNARSSSAATSTCTPARTTRSHGPMRTLRPTNSDRSTNAGLKNLWDNLLADAPSAAYSYTFQGQAQTLDQLFVNPALYNDLVQMRAAHIDAGWPADYEGDGARGVSDTTRRWPDSARRRRCPSPT